MGYTTLYGDSVGGFGALSDVAKTLVYNLARWRNTTDAGNLAGGAAPIPADSITKPPSAELARGQQDADNLPDYDLLDAILELYVEHDSSPEQVVAALGSFIRYPG